MPPTHPAFENLRVQVEVTTHCNVQCKMCIRPQMIAVVGARHMDWDVFQRVVDQAPPKARFCLQGTGEPFIHPRFDDMVRACKIRGFYVETYTNGLLYDPARVIGSGLDRLMVSLLGATVEGSDARIERGNFRKVLAKLKELHRMKIEQGAKTPDIAFNVCVMRENVGELVDTILLAHRFGASYVQFTPVGDNPDLLALSGELEIVRPLIEEAARESSVKCNLYRLEAGVHQRFKSCMWPWIGYYIMVDGRVGPCCTRPHLPSAWLPGHVRGIGSMADAWSGDSYRLFREALATREKATVPPMCRECVEYDVG